jgi:hypothetical protein
MSTRPVAVGDLNSAFPYYKILPQSKNIAGTPVLPGDFKPLILDDEH